MSCVIGGGNRRITRTLVASRLVYSVIDPHIERDTVRQASLRLLPFLFLLYILCYLDRSNVSIAALQMNKELKFSSATFGFGAGIFFLGYALFEVPSNLILARVGARRWLARIAITWGLLACAMIPRANPSPVLHRALPFGCGGGRVFSPASLYYLSQWFPMTYRARAISAIVIGIPLSGALGGPLGGALLGLSGVGHLSGWQWLFLIEGLPPVLLGTAALGYLTERPEDARGLSPEQQRWLSHRLEQERQQTGVVSISPLRALANPLVGSSPFHISPCMQCPWATLFGRRFWCATRSARAMPRQGLSSAEFFCSRPSYTL